LHLLGLRGCFLLGTFRQRAELNTNNGITIRENFVGHKAEEAISRAKSIAQIMQARIE
jgi:hypothetical protein